MLNTFNGQFVLTPYAREAAETDGDQDVADVFDWDTQARLKINLGVTSSTSGSRCKTPA